MKRLVLLIVALAVGALPAAAQQQPLLSVHAMPAEGYRPLLRIGPVLDDDALLDALRSGLPLRIRIRTELWRDAVIDDLRGSESLVMVVRYEPLERRYLVHESREPDIVRTYADYGAARTVVERAFPLTLRPRNRGRHYYLAHIEVETLALSDLEEVENWLRGELRPAVRGNRSIFSAFGQGAKRLFIRVLGLPARQASVRSAIFDVP